MSDSLTHLYDYTVGDRVHCGRVEGPQEIVERIVAARGATYLGTLDKEIDDGGCADTIMETRQRLTRRANNG